MTQRPAMIALPPSLAAALAQLAHDSRLSVPDLVRELVDDRLHRQECDLDRLDILGDLSQARSWPELQGRLKLKGLDLRGPASDLRITVIATGQDLGGLAKYGTSVDALSQRFGCPYPAPLLRWDMDAALDCAARPATASRRDDQAAKA